MKLRYIPGRYGAFWPLLQVLVLFLLSLIIMPLVVPLCGCGSSESEKPPLSIALEAGVPEWEVGERTGHTLRITNQSAAPLTLPAFRFLNLKEEDAEVAFYVKERILQLQVMRGTQAVPINEDWRTPPEKPGEFQTVRLQPGESITETFSLTRRWAPSFFSLTEPGAYTVTLALDTTRVRNSDVLKGRFTSAPCTFRIVPVATFRQKAADESQADYAMAKVAFYLKRIEGREGEYFPNVGNILDTQDAVPALIEMLDSTDERKAARARSLLEQIHHRMGLPDAPATPTSRDQWTQWWNAEGAKLSSDELWSNFDSHYQ